MVAVGADKFPSERTRRGGFVVEVSLIGGLLVTGRLGLVVER